MRVVLGFLFSVLSLFGQVTSTDTEGKGGIDIFASESYYPSPSFSAHTADVLVLIGLNNKLDLLAGAVLNLGYDQGATERQWAVEGGIQYKFFEHNNWRVMGLSLATAPFTNRASGDCSIFTALTINKDVIFLGKKLTPYGGWGPTFPCRKGQEEKSFSYKDRVTNFPIGAMIPLGERTQLFIEYGAKKPDYLSFGISWNLRKSR